MFTTDKLITSVTPRAAGSELALSRKNNYTLDPTVFREVLQCEIQREETSYFFLKVGTSVPGEKCETILLI